MWMSDMSVQYGRLENRLLPAKLSPGPLGTGLPVGADG